MSYHRAINVILTLITCLIIVFSMTGCKSDTGPLEDVTDQVTLSSVTGPDFYTYPGATKFLYVKCDNSNNLPDKPVYVWTIQLDGDIVNELIHDKYVPVRQDDDETEDEEDEWPCTDEIKYEFLQEGTYKIRIDLYDNEEYKTLKNLAPRRGTYTYTVYCQPIRVNITATPTGESREYTFKATVENKNVLGLYFYPQWKFLHWVSDPLVGALHDDGTTETTTEEDDLGFPSGVYTATHQFRQDSKYRIVFLLHNEKDNEIAKTDIALEVTGVELAIRVPEQPLKTGQEYTFTAQNDYPEKMPEDPVYEWDFGDNNGKIIPFSNEATHLYEKEGTYTVRVLLFESDEEAAPLLGVATAEVKVEAGAADFLSYIQQTTHLLVGVRGDTTYYQSDGYTRSQEGATLSAYLSLSSTSWEGTHFSNRYFSPPTDSSSGMSITIEGDVSQEGDKVFNLSATCIYDDAHRLAGEERETRISIVNVKLEPESPIPSTYDPNYKPQFVAYIEGPEVANYVTSTFYEHRQPQTSDPGFKMWYDPLRFTETTYTPYLLIVFKTERIDAYDDPGYQQRD